MAAAMAKVLRGGRSISSSEVQQLTSAIYRRVAHEGVAPLRGPSQATQAAGMGRLMHTRHGANPVKNSPSDLEKLKTKYFVAGGSIQEYGTLFSVLHLSDRLDTTASAMSIQGHYLPLKLALATFLTMLAVDVFGFGRDSRKEKKKVYQDFTLPASKFKRDASAAEESVRRMEMEVALKAAVSGGLAQQRANDK